MISDSSLNIGNFMKLEADRTEKGRCNELLQKFALKEFVTTGWIFCHEQITVEIWEDFKLIYTSPVVGAENH